MGEVINLTKIRVKKKSKSKVYSNALEHAKQCLMDNGHLLNQDISKLYPTVSKIALYGVRTINTMRNGNNLEELTEQQDLINLIRIALSLLSIEDWKNIFPIEKTYDGEKWACKDYFYTVKYLEENIIEDVMVADKLDDLLWEYQNNDLRMFSVRCFSIANSLARAEGKEDLTTLIAREFNIDTYTLHNDGTVSKNERKPNLKVITNNTQEEMI